MMYTHTRGKKDFRNKLQFAPTLIANITSLLLSILTPRGQQIQLFIGHSHMNV